MENNQEMKVTSSTGKVVATHLIEGDRISVNLVATKPDGARMSAGGLFNHLGNAVDEKGQEIPSTSGLDLTLLGGKAQPEFNTVKYQELVEQGSMEAAEDLKSAYEIEMENFDDEGGLSLPDAIANAALDWADRCHGVKTTDGDHPVVKPDQVVVRNVVRENAQDPGVFVVQITPSWG